MSETLTAEEQAAKDRADFAEKPYKWTNGTFAGLGAFLRSIVTHPSHIEALNAIFGTPTTPEEEAARAVFDAAVAARVAEERAAIEAEVKKVLDEQKAAIAAGVAAGQAK